MVKQPFPACFFVKAEKKQKTDKNRQYNDYTDLKYSLNEIGFLRLFTNCCYNQLILTEKRKMKNRKKMNLLIPLLTVNQIQS